jgi:hypothetical protein
MKKAEISVPVPELFQTSQLSSVYEHPYERHILYRQYPVPSRNRSYTTNTNNLDIMSKMSVNPIDNCQLANYNLAKFEFFYEPI